MMTAYPDFWRVVPSDAQQGQAAMSDVITAGSSVPAILMMSNDYGTGLGLQSNEWHANGGSTCCQMIFHMIHLDFDGAAIAQQVYGCNCDSVVLASYAADGEQLITDLQTAGFTGAILWWRWSR